MHHLTGATVTCQEEDLGPKLKASNPKPTIKFSTPASTSTVFPSYLKVGLSSGDLATCLVSGHGSERASVLHVRGPGSKV